MDRLYCDALMKARKNKGLSQHQLAELLGKTVNTVSNWERGIYTPDAKTRKRLQEILFDDEMSDEAYLLKEPLTGEELDMIRMYRQLDDVGQHMVRVMSREMCEYQKTRLEEEQRKRMEAYARKLEKQGAFVVQKE